MVHLWNMARAVTFLYCLLPVSAWRCTTFLCFTRPLSLKLWHKGVELDTKYISVQEGETLSVTCDGSCVGKNDPLLRWYGTDESWIAYPGKHNRIHTKDSFKKRFQKLVIHNVTPNDAGYYTCRGYLGPGVGYKEKYIRVKVVHRPGPLSSLLKTTTTTKTTTTPITTTTTTTTVPTTTTSHVPAVITTEGYCDSSQFKCDNGQCIDSRFTCDNFPECDDESDETHCGPYPKSCPEGEVLCRDGSECIGTAWMCDGESDCSDGSDEDTLNCGA